jgi:hypothetical protein
VAVLSMSGAQRCAFQTRDLGTDSGLVTVQLGGSVLYIHTSPAAERIREIWMDGAEHAASLPPGVATTRGRQALATVQVSAVMHTTGRPAGVVTLQNPDSPAAYLHVQIGGLVMQLRDQVAFNSVSPVIMQACEIGAAQLPDADRRMGGVAPTPPTLGGHAAARAMQVFANAAHPGHAAAVQAHAVPPTPVRTPPNQVQSSPLRNQGRSR